MSASRQVTYRSGWARARCGAACEATANQNSIGASLE